MAVSPLGRKRFLPEIRFGDKDLAGRAERQGINTPVQSMASDITLLAMILIDSNLRAAKLTAKIVGQVHDAILVETLREHVERVSVIVKSIMEVTLPKVLKNKFGVELDIPLKADIECGAWGSGVPLKEFLKKA